jgi:hypothetical protein
MRKGRTTETKPKCKLNSTRISDFNKSLPWRAGPVVTQEIKAAQPRETSIVVPDPTRDGFNMGDP